MSFDKLYLKWTLVGSIGSKMKVAIFFKLTIKIVGKVSSIAILNMINNSEYLSNLPNNIFHMKSTHTAWSSSRQQRTPLENTSFLVTISQNLTCFFKACLKLHESTLLTRAWKCVLMCISNLSYLHHKINMMRSFLK